jgi:hypothetical protein
MKKYISVLFTLLFLAVNISAQEEAASSGVLTNKKGIPILPKKGDCAIGISANPFLNYVGNMFNNTANNSLALSSYTLYFKYYLADNAAVRVFLDLDNSKSLYKEYVRDDAAYLTYPLSQAKVIDTRSVKDNYLGIGLSVQKYRGYGRLQGFYGIYANYYQGRTQTEYTYGNVITEANPDPSNYYEGVADNSAGGAGRKLYDDGGFGRSLGLGLLGGVEFFFMPKASIGVELDLGYSYNWSTQSNAKYEIWDGEKVSEYERPSSPGTHSSSLYTYLPTTYGGLFLMFHF